MPPSDYDRRVSAAPRFREWLVRRGRRSSRSSSEPSAEQPPSAVDRQSLAAGRGLYSRWIQPGALVFDVGANVGSRTSLFLDLGARVVAVEPQPDCVEVLRTFDQDRLIIEQVALGAVPGRATMRVASENTISSMADEWIDRVRGSGRFAAYSWPATISVEVSTLDALIERYGVPAFCKIDVEGYEPEVARGLSQRVPLLSFEFTAECADRTESVLERLEELGFERFNFSPEETFGLAWDDWRDAAELRRLLESLSAESLAWGDIYAGA